MTGLHALATGFPFPGFRVFDAIDGNELDERDYRDRWRGDWWKVMRGRLLSPGDIGCFLSHYALWKRMVATGEKHAVIMEDDVIVGHGFSDAVRTVLGCEWKWDIVLLSPKKRYPTDRTLCPLDDSGRSLVRFRRLRAPERLAGDAGVGI